MAKKAAEAASTSPKNAMKAMKVKPKKAMKEAMKAMKVRPEKAMKVPVVRRVLNPNGTIDIVEYKNLPPFTGPPKKAMKTMKARKTRYVMKTSIFRRKKNAKLLNK